MQEAICEHWFRKGKEAINVDGGLGGTHAEEWEQSLLSVELCICYWEGSLKL